MKRWKMPVRERAKLVSEVLQHLYPEPQVPLQHSSHYTLLIAVLLSAQCTDKRVNAVTPKLFARAATPGEMVQLPVGEIEAMIQPCGLSPTKARAISELSRLLLERHGGTVPDTLEELEALPGVGHKTASVILCQAFGKPAFPVDTHIHRCAKRWGLSTGRNVQQTEKDLKTLFPKEHWIRLHLQIIYFAREHCPARGHNVTQCPICSRVAA